MGVYSCWTWVASVGLQQDEKDSVLILPREGKKGRREGMRMRKKGRGEERMDKTEINRKQKKMTKTKS